MITMMMMMIIIIIIIITVIIILAYASGHCDKPDILTLLTKKTFV